MGMSSICSLDLRTAAALHHTLVLWYITNKSLLLLCIQTPSILKRIKVHLHDLRQNLALAFLLDSVDQLVEDP